MGRVGIGLVGVEDGADMIGRGEVVDKVVVDFRCGICCCWDWVVDKTHCCVVVVAVVVDNIHSY